MIVEVLYAHTDGTTMEDTYEAPRISTQMFRTGRALVRLRDENGNETGAIHYRRVTRIAKGSAVTVQQAEESTE